jgi:hypothetical protein
VAADILFIFTPNRILETIFLRKLKMTLLFRTENKNKNKNRNEFSLKSLNEVLAGTLC